MPNDILTLTLALIWLDVCRQSNAPGRSGSADPNLNLNRGSENYQNYHGGCGVKNEGKAPDMPDRQRTVWEMKTQWVGVEERAEREKKDRKEKKESKKESKKEKKDKQEGSTKHFPRSVVVADPNPNPDPNAYTYASPTSKLNPNLIP